MDTLGGTEKNAAGRASVFNRAGMYTQHLLDRATPFVAIRWSANAVLVILFFLRIVWLQGFYIIAYGLGIFLLNQFILFLTPKQDPSLRDIDDAEGDHIPRLPTRSTDEFRPFMRRLPEFKFWYTAFKALIISLLLTLFSIFDVPVFWPVLVIYFFTLFFLTMRQRIAHMIQYKYIPFTHGKVKYAGKNEGPPGGAPGIKTASY